MTNKLSWRLSQYAPAPCKLTFDLLTLKVVSESLVTWVTSVPILVFLGLSVLDLGSMYTTDRQTRQRSDARHRLMRMTVSVTRVFYTTRGRPRASMVGLLQRSLGRTSCQSTQPTAVRSPRGSATDLRRPSIRPRYNTAAAAALAVSARTSDIQTLRHGVSLSA